MNATVTALHPARTPTAGTPTAGTATAGTATARADRATGGRTGLRLTRRGRVVVSALTFLAVLVIGTVALLLVARPAASASAGGVESVTVESGETVWSMAVEHGAEDPSDFAHDVRMLNNLSGTGVTAGSSLLVPVGEAD